MVESIDGLEQRILWGDDEQAKLIDGQIPRRAQREVYRLSVRKRLPFQGGASHQQGSGGKVWRQ